MKKEVILLIFLLSIPLATANPEQELLNKINRERSINKLPPLKEASYLTTAAILHTKDMLENGYLEHTNLKNVSVYQRIINQGFKGGLIGENIGAHSGPINTSLIFQLWKASPPHYKKIINPNYTHIGIGIISGNYKYFNRYSTVYTTDFGRSKKRAKKKSLFTLLKKVIGF